MRILRILAAAALISGFSVAPPVAVPALAQSGLSQQGFETFLPQLRSRALREGVSRATIDRVFPALTFSSRTIELDRAQPGGAAGSSAIPPFAPYRVRHLTQSLIDRGRSRYSANVGRLNEIGRRYGVPPGVLVAIWGKETSYGSIMGDFDLLNSLASLAYEGRRRALFTEEFIATLKMMDRGFPRSELTGSWAGATGQSQFLPTVYIRLAVDGDGDGRADIWESHLDALASIANYLRNAGWRPGQPWGVAAQVPAGFNRAAVANRLRAPRCAPVHARHSRWLTVAEWRRLGVVPLGNIPNNAMASLLEPDGPGRTAYLLTTNYRSILDYNCSNFYALTVGLLADSISR
ncbi:lytic murein transglycosylase [Sphingosinicella sp. LHD-64]|uniref:lytic murein transglycosylase n=1 Tax=Sphingosinicella sp. LHD-64 TaxID=3072139 RepID=UPI00280F6BCB|nr:lytic murein transglycosylase [Sphingosinicella sp. LHD-64]MDQ8754802.1 lytic murein transglycosylase [Sphingosinicella sp. LHD-64]